MKRLYSSLFCAAVAAVMSVAAHSQYTMGDYTINPASGSTVKSIEVITVTFNGTADGIDQHILPSNVGQYITITSGDKVYRALEYHAGAGLASSEDELYIRFPKITMAGTYTLNIAEGVVKDYDQAESAEAGDGYSVNGPITATYTIAEKYMNVWELDPEDGSTVTSLSTITLTFPRTATRDGIDEYGNPTAHITLTCGETVYRPTRCDLNSDYTAAIIKFERITTPGNYVLNIPAESYQEFDSWGESVNPEINAYYTISDNSSVDDVAVGAEPTTVTVVDLMGRVILSAADKGSVDALAPGFYVINGKKTLISK